LGLIYDVLTMRRRKALGETFLVKILVSVSDFFYAIYNYIILIDIQLDIIYKIYI